jgi:hypothetical protein
MVMDIGSMSVDNATKSSGNLTISAREEEKMVYGVTSFGYAAKE